MTDHRRPTAMDTTDSGEVPRVPRPDLDGPRVPEGDWQHLWFALQRTPWSSLAIVPADSGLDVRDVAAAIVDVGRTSGTTDVALLNGMSASFTDAQELVETITAAARRGGHLIVACDSVDENPATLALAHASSHAVMVVRLGQSRMTAARRTVDALGRDHVLASITLRPQD